MQHRYIQVILYVNIPEINNFQNFDLFPVLCHPFKKCRQLILDWDLQEFFSVHVLESLLSIENTSYEALSNAHFIQFI